MTIKIASLLFTSIVFIDAILIVGDMSERERERERLILALVEHEVALRCYAEIKICFVDMNTDFFHYFGICTVQK